MSLGTRLAAVSLENSLAEPVRGDLDERGEPPMSESEFAHQRARTTENPSDLASGRSILRVGEEVPILGSALRRTKARRYLRCGCRGVQPPHGAGRGWHASH